MSFSIVRRLFRGQILECANKLSNLKMDMGSFLRQKVMPQKAFERAGSATFIAAAKEGDLKTMQRLLEKNRFYVFDYDNLHQTALHWAAKRNNKDAIELLVEHGANVNAQDIVRSDMSSIGGEDPSASRKQRRPC